MTFADLARDTTARVDPADPAVEHRYRITLPDHWDYMLPSGGVVMTCALRAAQARLADHELKLASATTIFASPVHPGELVADTHVIRQGRAAAQVRVVIRHAQARDAGAQAELVATFCRDRKGPDVVGAAFPAVASLADARSVDDGAQNNPHARVRFYQQIECKLADGAPFWTAEFEAGPARFARWMRYRAPQRDASGLLDRLALPPLIDTMPAALHRAIGPGGYRFHAPSLDLTVYTVDDTTREWLLVASTVRRARAGWAIGDAEVWDDEGRLLAYGSQAMFLQGVSGEPPIVDASRRP
jgi:acyl-CoA thioesterase